MSNSPAEPLAELPSHRSEALDEAVEVPRRRFFRIPRPDLLISLSLILLIVVAYWRVYGFNFVGLDDSFYVFKNKHLAEGFTLSNLDWILYSFDPDNWFPLTRLSHLIDYQLWGPKPSWMHVENVAIHALSTLLLFGFLRRATGVRWPCAFVAALFAIHPLHVESVAWVAERKDVLCAFFWFATLWAWLRYVERPAPRRYFDTLVLFSLGLMAKPMIVTLPCLLILLDLWPFRRSERYPVSLRRLILEKIPFFALSGATILFTMMAQRAAVQPLDNLSLALRFENALVTIFSYIGEMFWPVHLWIPYAYPTSVPAGTVAAVAVGFLLISAAVLLQRRARPFLAVGWFWYVGTLIPVIGLVQVGPQSHADRYMYVPMVGLSIMLAWGISELASRLPRLRVVLAGAAAAFCLCLTGLTWSQTQYWDNTDVLFRHAIEMDPRNYLAWLYLAMSQPDDPAYYDDAVRYAQNAVRLNPLSADGHNNLAIYLTHAGKVDEGLAEYRKSVQIRPRSALGHYNLGVAFVHANRSPEAMDEFRLSARLDPTFASPHNDLGVELFKIPARRAESIHELETAIRLDNDLGRAHMNLGMALIDTPGRLVDAIPQFKEALRVDPRDIKAHLGMATVCMKTGLWPEAIAHLDAAQRIAPTPERQALLNRMIDDHPNLVIPPDAASDPTHDVTINTIH